MSTISPQGPQVAASGNDPTPAPLESKKSEPRPYIVLRKHVGESPSAPQMWEQVATIDATSAEQAIRRAAETPGTSFLNPDGPTTLVAVPSRSFNPQTVSVQTSTTIVLS